MSQSLLFVALGGALGAVTRYWVGLLSLNLATQSSGTVFPWATLSINIAGSFAIGLLWNLFAEASWFQEWGRALIVVGLLGGFTTFSAFSLETLMLFDNNKWQAAIYVLASVSGCLGAVAIGYWIGDLT